MMSRKSFTDPSLAIAVWPFVLVIIIQMVFCVFSFYTLSATRAYVAGENHWSKAQRQAVYALDLYAGLADPAYLAEFRASLAVIKADRDARIALDRPVPDRDAARRAYLIAGNDPQDVDKMVWLFCNFRSFVYLEDAILHWKASDAWIAALEDLADKIAAAPKPHAAADVRNWSLAIKQIDTRIAPLAIAFSRSIENGARFVEHFLIIVDIGLALFLAVLMIWRKHRMLIQRREIEAALTWQASHDGLTETANRREFEHQLRRALEPRVAGRAGSHALIFLDLDQFKIVNDTCGHAAGDALLIRICRPLEEALREQDLLARLGGDEFGILLRHCSLEYAESAAERLRAIVESVTFVWGQRLFKVTASIGLVHTDHGLVIPHEMMRAADMACYLAKEKGRNRVHVQSYGDKELSRHAGALNWIHRIHRALDEDRFCLHAQSIVPLVAGAHEGHHIELLIRLQEGAETLVPPSTFVAAAERFGLMPQIDRWVVRTAFRMLAGQVERGLDLDCCAINLSGKTIGDEAFLGFLKAEFRRSGLSPSLICFEITETMAITNLQAAGAFIEDLRALGCRFSLDDFGAGMSSFGHLKTLHVDYVKIDGSFVCNLLEDKADRAMVEMINHIGHVMGKRIIAECVETDDVIAALRDIGVDYAQGFAIARPRPLSEVLSEIAGSDRAAPARRCA